MTDFRAAALVAVVALVTIGLRFLPFVIFRGRETPKYILYLGNVLPFAIMGMLVVYCLRNTSLSNPVPEIVSVALVALLHLWKKNTLLSIIAGTVCYMVLVQMIF